MLDGFSFALGVDQQPAGQVERSGVGEDLIQVGVGDRSVVDALVLGITDEFAGVPAPPNQIRFKADTPTRVE